VISLPFVPNTTMKICMKYKYEPKKSCEWRMNAALLLQYSKDSFTSIQGRLMYIKLGVRVGRFRGRAKSFN
jgi:hypothetical protein